MLRDLVEAATGSRVVDLRAHESSFGSSRKAYVADTESGRVFVRCAVPGLGLESTLFNLARESAILEALAELGLRVPRPLLISDDGTAVVLEWRDGEVGPCGDEIEREHLARRYVELLAAVADLDPAAVLPDDLRTGTTVSDAIALDLRRWREIAPPSFFADVIGASLLDWLVSTAPAANRRAGVVHGDAGHGNFLVIDHDVAALIDWELCHLGDPVEDVACMQMRSLGRDPSIWRRALTSFHEGAGREIELGRLAWERVHVLVRSAIAMHRSLERGKEGRAEAPFARFKEENLLLSLREVERLSHGGWPAIADLDGLRREAERRCEAAGPPSPRLRGADIAFGYPGGQ